MCKNSISLFPTFKDHLEGLPFIEILCVDSSNNYAMAWINEGLATHQMSFFAHFQSEGRGQPGKQWKSPASKNILLSTVFEPKGISFSLQPIFNMAIALGVKEFYECFTRESVKLKWPNDLYVNDKKAGGILIENRIKGNNWAWAVVGMGININQDDFQNQINATSLKVLTGETYPIKVLAKLLLKQVYKYFEKLKAGEIDWIFNTYNESLYKKGLPITYEIQGVKSTGILKGVDSTGRLILYTQNKEMRFNSGELKWIIV